MRLDKARILDLVQDVDIAPLKLGRIEPEVPLSNIPAHIGGDLFFEIRWDNSRFPFKAEVMTVANPKAIIHAIWKVQKDRSTEGAVGPEWHPLIVAPYLSDRVMKMLLDQRISGIDLSGNVQLIVAGQLFFSRLGRQNQFPSNDPIKNVYRWSSSLVPRVFFSKPRYTSVSDLHMEIRVRGGTISLGTVSKALKTMEGDLFISRGSGISLIDPDGLLQRLKDSFALKSETRRKGRVENVDEFTAHIAAKCAMSGVLYCLDRPARYAVSPAAELMTRVYVENARIALNETAFEPDDEFPNVELIETSDPSIYFDRRSEGGSLFASPIQSYLGLMRTGDSDRQMEEQIRAELLADAY